MDAVFPITQRNGEPYHTLSDFTKLFDQVKSGRYLLGQGYGWHSGVHLTSKMVPWGKGLRPIQAMMDGKIVAYRIHADYQTTIYKDQELKYSNNFVLLEHEYKNPEKDDDVFKLYSLYMHLAPPSDIGANSSLTTRYKLVDDGWNVRTFKLGGDPERGKVESKVSMSSGTVLEYLHAEEQETVGFEIGGHTYKMIKCRVVQLGDSPSSSEKQMKGKIVWFAAGKESDFDILNDTSVMVPEPVSEPDWMSKNAASLRDGSVVTLDLPLPLNIDFGAIEVKAGDELGYMGLHEYSNDAHATKKEDNRVHIELFSVEKPPEFFLKKIAPKNAEESPLITIDGSGSDGALSVSNAFYSQLLEELSKGEEIDFSAFKPREAKVYLENKRKHFERVIAKHPSDWYTDVTKDSYSMIHQLAKEVMDEKYMTGFISEKDYLESPWRSEVMNHHEVFSKHELERADKFSWMQDTQSKITLPDDKSVWHYWPFSLVKAGRFMFTLSNLVEVFDNKVPANKHYLLQEMASELNEHIDFYELNTPLKRCHFFAQIVQETGKNLRTIEDATYSVTALKSLFSNANTLRYPDGKLIAEVHGYETTHISGGIKSRYKSDGSLFTSDDEVAILNLIYAGRDTGNGDFESGDGSRFRGRGLKQVTGRYNYEEFNQWHKENQILWPSDIIDTIENPSLLASMPYAVRSATYFWLERKLYEKAVDSKKETVDSITRVINRNTTSYSKRVNHFNRLWSSKVLHI
ncbi:hypothetical protein CKF94_03675 [Vibrio coralliilyticus]|uniref:glycoside hydrolase family 19 protein n=1 Tax=Vibrio coralliilyticus TaxID=190893 RepID=UPI000BAB0721|nr:hypothetical protein [Vibrio coralliilyticus]PAU40175.1 hypothetical protein CKF94_03675 [Vibrio coralliilyticus]